MKNAFAYLCINGLGHLQCHEHLKKGCVALGFFYLEVCIS